jgi:hypothetical protein
MNSIIEVGLIVFGGIALLVILLSIDKFIDNFRANKK